MKIDLTAPLAALAAEQGNLRLDGAHCYWRGKKRVPGVTTVAKKLDAPQLDDWKVRTQVEGTARAAYLNPPMEYEPQDAYAARLCRLAAEQYEHERIAGEAAVLGTEIHALIEHHVKAQLGQTSFEPEVSEHARFAFAGWLEWANATDFRPLATECRVYHAEHDYCGTVDVLALVNGRAAVLDWKSNAKTVYESHRLQSAAYRRALESMGWPPLDGYVVGLGVKDGSDVTMFPIDGDVDEDFRAFLACLELHRWTAGLERARRAARREKPAA